MHFFSSFAYFLVVLTQKKDTRKKNTSRTINYLYFRFQRSPPLFINGKFGGKWFYSIYEMVSLNNSYCYRFTGYRLISFWFARFFQNIIHLIRNLASQHITYGNSNKKIPAKIASSQFQKKKKYIETWVIIRNWNYTNSKLVIKRETQKKDTHF